MRSRQMLMLLFCAAVLVGACGEDNAANTGNEVVEACSQIICPPGTTRFQDSSAEGQCSGSGSLELLTESGEISAQCVGSGECLIICLPPEPCCLGEKWTTDSYSCDQPCAASACADELPKCSIADGDEVVLACADHGGTGVLNWGEDENCTAEDKTCAMGAGGAFCAECDEDSDCDDGDPCTQGESCDEEHVCAAGTPVGCDNGDPCDGEETCDSSTAQGCVDGAPLQCDDGDACTGIETCDSDTVDGCSPGVPMETDDGVTCTQDACDPESGEVTHVPDDALCDDDDPCTDDGCVTQSGCEHTLNTAPCDDDVECTAVDTCSEGTCSGISTSYEKTVEGDYGGYAPVAVAETADGGLVLFHMGADQSAHATRYGPLGDLVSTCALSLESGPQQSAIPVIRSAQRAPGTDNHVVVGELEGGIPFVAIFDPSCTSETHWSGEDGLTLNSLAVAADGSVAVVGRQNSSSDTGKESVFMRLNSVLEMMTMHVTENQTLRRVRYLTPEAADGGGEGFVAVGSTLDSGSSCDPSCFGFGSLSSSAAVTRWSLGGTLTQFGTVSHGSSPSGESARVTYASDVISPAQGGDGYIVVGQAELPGASGPLAGSTFGWIGKTNVGLNALEWSALHGEALQFDLKHRFNHVSWNASQDGYVTLGTRVLDYTLEYHDVWTAQLSSTGELVAETLYGGGGDQSLSSAATLETGFALAALKTSAEAYVPYAAWLIRTDLQGEPCSGP